MAEDEQMMVSGDIGEDFVYGLSHLEEPPFLFIHPGYSNTTIRSVVEEGDDFYLLIIQS